MFSYHLIHKYYSSGFGASASTNNIQIGSVYLPSMINILALTSLAIATLYMSVTPAAAHGYVSIPPSRQARCRAGEIAGCGAVQYEPQSVEAAKGSFKCNGDGARFPELNDDIRFADHFFSVPAGTDILTFVWTLTAPHRTTTWDYVVITADNTILETFDSHNSTPPFIVEHEVPLRGITGRQTVLARWNIGDTPAAFYACVDLFIESSSTRTAVAAAAATPLPIAMPVALRGPEIDMAANDTGLADVGSVNMALPYIYVVQGASV